VALLSLIVFIDTSYLAEFDLRDRERITLLTYSLVDFVLELLQGRQLSWYQVFDLPLFSPCLFCLFSGIVVIDVKN
jgi:hypothetical protein